MAIVTPVHRERVVNARESGSPQACSVDDEVPRSAWHPAGYTEHGGPTGEPWPERAPVISADEAEELSGRWRAIQTGFIEAPHIAVEQADALVSDVIQRVVQTFKDEQAELRASLRIEPSTQADTSTEELRLAIRRYRSLLGRLLAF